MVRTPSFDKSGLKKGTWTPEEDSKLIAYVTRYGCWNWRQLPRFAGLARCGKSCRLRWMNYLRPNLKRGNYTPEEEDTIIQMHKKLGNRWSAIATHLPGRTDNEIKNHWHTSLKKRFHPHNSSSSLSKKSKDSSSTSSSSSAPTSRIEILDSTPLSPQSSSTSIPTSDDATTTTTTTTTTTITHQNSTMDVDYYDDSPFLDHASSTDPLTPDFWADLIVDDISYVVPTQTTTPIGAAISQTLTTDHVTDTCASSSETLCTQIELGVEDEFGFLSSFSEAAFDDFVVEPCLPAMSHLPSPFVTTELEYLCPLYDFDLWSQTNLYV